MLAQPKVQRKATNSCVVHHSKFETSMSASGQRRTKLDVRITPRFLCRAVAHRFGGNLALA